MNEALLAKQMTKQDAAMMGALELAYVGDCVFELIVRTRLLRTSGRKVKELHGLVVKHVCAAGQAALANRIFDQLTDDELAVFKRGRNHQANVPKSASVSQYRKATGMETLFAYLHLSGQTERMHRLFYAAFIDDNDKTNTDKG